MAAPAVPAFLTKLWTLVDDSDTNDMISWDYVSISAVKSSMCVSDVMTD